jgi:GTP-binding protein HflX
VLSTDYEESGTRVRALVNPEYEQALEEFAVAR